MLSTNRVDASGVSVYNLSEGKSMPQFMSDLARRQKLKRDEGLRKRITIVQDFEFSSASSRIKVSEDGEFCVATGVYPPSAQIFEFDQLSLKVDRRVDSEIVQFEILDGDYSKLALLEADRSIELHAKFGAHYKTRIPRHGRDMCYDSVACDLLICGDSDEVWRLNLEQGTFQQSLTASGLSEGSAAKKGSLDDVISGINVLAINDEHRLVVAGTQDGIIYCFDPRARKAVSRLDVGAQAELKVSNGRFTPATSEAKAAGATANPVEVTALEFASDALTLGVGTDCGEVMLFDLRSARTMQRKRHNYGLPIHTVRFFDDPVGGGRGGASQERLVISADAKVVKMWERNTAKNWGHIECMTDSTDLCLVPDSGMLFLTGQQPRIMNYFLPALGPAPHWVTYLDNLTEELEETATELYDDYKVTFCYPIQPPLFLFSSLLFSHALLLPLSSSSSSSSSLYNSL